MENPEEPPHVPGQQNREDGNREDGNREDGNREDGNREDGNREDGNRERHPMETGGGQGDCGIPHRVRT